MTLQTFLSYIILAASATKVFSSKLTKSLSAKSMTLLGGFFVFSMMKNCLTLKHFKILYYLKKPFPPLYNSSSTKAQKPESHLQGM
jgi:hypothetical protein